VSRSLVLKTATESRLRLAAERAVRACGPVLARCSRSLMDNGQARELDEARGALMDLAKALETH
jgi:hypothetical protein